MQEMEKTEKVRDYCAALAENIAALRKGRSVGGLRTDMKDAGFDIGTGTLARIIAGDRGVRIESLGKVADYFKIEVDFLLRPADEDAVSEFVHIPHADVTLSAGHGAVVYEDGSKSSLSFRRTYLRNQGVSEKNAVVVNVKGHSMEPMIGDGSVLLVNRAHGPIANGLVYAFRWDGHLFIKKLFKTDSGYLAQSENPDKDEYPDMHISEKSGDFEMIGRAIWMGRKL